jgi:hypothetical protein
MQQNGGCVIGMLEPSNLDGCGISLGSRQLFLVGEPLSKASTVRIGRKIDSTPPAVGSSLARTAPAVVIASRTRIKSRLYPSGLDAIYVVSRWQHLVALIGIKASEVAARLYSKARPDNREESQENDDDGR